LLHAVRFPFARGYGAVVDGGLTPLAFFDELAAPFPRADVPCSRAA
jgi:hypothetical protein